MSDEGFLELLRSTPDEPTPSPLLDGIHAAWTAGYDAGYAHGVNARARQVEADERHAQAAAVVSALAGLRERDHAEDERRAAQREVYWQARREGRWSA